MKQTQKKSLKDEISYFNNWIELHIRNKTLDKIVLLDLERIKKKMMTTLPERVWAVTGVDTRKKQRARAYAIGFVNFVPIVHVTAMVGRIREDILFLYIIYYLKVIQKLFNNLISVEFYTHTIHLEIFNDYGNC